MSLSVPKVSCNQVSFQGAKINSKACKAGMEKIQENKKPFDIISVMGLAGWLFLIVTSAIVTTKGLIETLQNRQNTEVNVNPSDTLNSNTKSIDILNV